MWSVLREMVREQGLAALQVGLVGILYGGSLSLLNIESAIPFITVAKSKRYWQGVKSIVFGA